MSIRPYDSDPYTASESSILERVQRPFLFFAGHVLMINQDLVPVLNSLGLTALTGTRVGTNLTFLQRCINGTYDSPIILSYVRFRVSQHPTMSIAPFSSSFVSLTVVEIAPKIG